MNNYPKALRILTYNIENYLKECLDSIINQNYPKEMVVTDDNKNIVKVYMAKFLFIKEEKSSGYLSYLLKIRVYLKSKTK